MIFSTTKIGHVIGLSAAALALTLNAGKVSADENKFLQPRLDDTMSQAQGGVLADGDVLAASDVLIAKAQKRGSVRIIVRLKSAPQATAQFATAQASAQRAAITSRQESLLNSLRFQNIRSVKRFKYTPFMAMEVDSLALAELRASSDVVDIIEDVPVPPALSESVPLIGADAAWAAGYSGAGQTIAILDTGIDKDHPFLAGKVVAEACFSSTFAAASATTVCPDGSNEQIGEGAAAAAPSSAYGYDHGTHVAGIAAGAQGVAKDAKLIAVQVFSQVNSQELCRDLPAPCVLTYPSDYALGLQYVYDLREAFTIASVNMSVGGGRFTAACDSSPDIQAVKSHIDNLRSIGIATVIASGNESYKDAVGAPACISSAISVGATDKSDWVADFSNSADFLDLLAPGVSINSSVPGGGFEPKNGTSMATPHVAGAFAVLKSKAPQASVDELLSALQQTGVPVTDNQNGLTTPRIQIDRALEALDSQGSGEPPGPVSLISPVGSITDTLPTYEWSAQPQATWYYLWVQDSTGQQVVGEYVLPSEAGCVSGENTCSINPSIELTVNQSYKWWIAAGNDSNNYAWSEGASFAVTE